MAKPKLRIVLHSVWYFLIAILLIFIIFFDFEFTNHLWFFIPFLIICTFIGPLIDKIAPKQKRSDKNGNN
ncbi:hypothetical protein [Staphylococcus equorum]|uniref:hypothetical protein n=1 Tax=Staphylococcus equorum TaxID=246432 RepID=UPI0008531757|nr:hypothetical protein [Staphylococcus equorum]OEK53124.1 hypothetical protein ASS97_12065 [Staphylococcus equorum]RYD13515.1 hypothetical protein CGA19_02440 [Staphylococcus equorum]